MANGHSTQQPLNNPGGNILPPCLCLVSPGFVPPSSLGPRLSTAALLSTEKDASPVQTAVLASSI